MSIESNKAVVATFCDLFTAGDMQGVLDLMSDDINYWILGSKNITPSAGDHSKAAMKRIFDAMAERTHGNMTFKAKSMIAEGDEVALEAQSYSQLKNGRVYNNLYHLRMMIRDGKIASIREYLDTHHVYETWYAPEPSAATASG